MCQKKLVIACKMQNHYSELTAFAIYIFMTSLSSKATYHDRQGGSGRARRVHNHKNMFKYFEILVGLAGPVLLGPQKA